MAEVSANVVDGVIDIVLVGVCDGLPVMVVELVIVSVGDCDELIVDDDVSEGEGVGDGTHTTDPAAESSDIMPATTFRRPPPPENK